MPGLVGLARLDGARGDLGGAIARWRKVVERLPLPEYVVGLGEAELAAGRRADARDDLALVGAERRLLAAAGVNTDVELALYEADHGDRARGVELARAAWTKAPSVRSADAMGWALTRAGHPRAGLRWAHRALRLGSLDAGLRFHAGMTALAAGRRSEGRRDLRLALAHGLAARRRGRRSRPAARWRAGRERRHIPRPRHTAHRSDSRCWWRSSWGCWCPAVAGAHPLGNFSVNHLTEVSVSADRVDVRYVLDQAEIPTFQERDLGDAAVLARKRAEVSKRLVVTVDGRRVALRPAGRAVLTHPAGQGGLRTTRVELPLTRGRTRRPARRGERRHVSRARRLEGRRGQAGERDGGALERARPGPDAGPAALSGRPAAQPGRPAGRVAPGVAGLRHARGPGVPGAARRRRTRAAATR